MYTIIMFKKIHQIIGMNVLMRWDLKVTGLGHLRHLNSLVLLGKGRTSLHVYIYIARDIKNLPGYEGGFQKQIITLVERYSCYRAANYSKTFRFQFHRQNII